MQEFDPQKAEINLTAAAKKHFKNMLAKKAEAIGIRFSTKKAGCSGLMYITDEISKPLAGDIELENTDIKLFIEAKSLPYLNGLTVDIEIGLMQQTKLVFTNPNEKGRCGCGESFKI